MQNMLTLHFQWEKASQLIYNVNSHIGPNLKKKKTKEYFLSTNLTISLNWIVYNPAGYWPRESSKQQTENNKRIMWHCTAKETRRGQG